jgi:hypothetical protein
MTQFASFFLSFLLLQKVATTGKDEYIIVEKNAFLSAKSDKLEDIQNE